MICLLLFYVLFSFTDLRFFIVMTYKITLKLFRNELFHMFLLWFIDLRLGHPYIHIVVSDTTSYWVACRPITSQYAATLPAYHLPTVPSVRTQRTIGLCIVSHYHSNIASEPWLQKLFVGCGLWSRIEQLQAGIPVWLSYSCQLWRYPFLYTTITSFTLAA